jgi:hypothetical protein
MAFISLTISTLYDPKFEKLGYGHRIIQGGSCPISVNSCLPEDVDRYTGNGTLVGCGWCESSVPFLTQSPSESLSKTESCIGIFIVVPWFILFTWAGLTIRALTLLAVTFTDISAWTNKPIREVKELSRKRGKVVIWILVVKTVSMAVIWHGGYHSTHVQAVAQREDERLSLISLSW